MIRGRVSSPRGSDDVAEVLALVKEWELVELELLGGKGLREEG